MRWQRRRAVGLVVILTLARLTAYAVGKPGAGVANRAYLLALGAVALHLLIVFISRLTDRPRRTEFDELATPRTTEVKRPVRLASLEDLAAFGAEKAQGTHAHLRPYVRELLAAKGIAVDTDPHAPELLGQQTWALVRPDRPAPADGRAPGLPTDDVLALTETLERIR